MLHTKRNRLTLQALKLLTYTVVISLNGGSYAYGEQGISHQNNEAVFWDSDFALPTTGPFFEDILPDFFHSAPKDTGPSMSISIQHMSGSHPALKDDERLDNFKPFEGDPLDRKEIVVEIPLE